MRDYMRHLPVNRTKTGRTAFGSNRRNHLRVISPRDEFKQRLGAKDLCHYIGELACELKLLAESAGCDKLAADLHCIAIEAVLEAQLQAR
jgi:hypothetical protein